MDITENKHWLILERLKVLSIRSIPLNHRKIWRSNAGIIYMIYAFAMDDWCLVSSHHIYLYRSYTIKYTHIKRQHAVLKMKFIVQYFMVVKDISKATMEWHPKSKMQFLRKQILDAKANFGREFRNRPEFFDDKWTEKVTKIAKLPQ